LSAICTRCSQDMADPTTTTCIPTDVAGVPVPPYAVRVDPEGAVDPDERCNDCGVMPTGFHHRWCDRAECPACAGQLLSCVHGGR
jgi:hypothetical protein